MWPVRGQVSGMLARPPRSVKQTSTRPWILETWALSFAGRNERARCCACGLPRGFPCHIWLPPVSICDARCPGEKLPSVQKLPNNLAHAAVCLSREPEEFSMNFWPTYRLPEQRQLSRQGKFLGRRRRYQINPSGEALAQERLVGSLDFHALLDVIQRRCPPLVADLCPVGQFECFLPVS